MSYNKQTRADRTVKNKSTVFLAIPHITQQPLTECDIHYSYRVMSTLLYATVLSWRSGDMRGESGRVWTAECTRGRGHLIPTLRDRQTMIAGGGWQ